jgi:hypothetical protein
MSRSCTSSPSLRLQGDSGSALLFYWYLREGTWSGVRYMTGNSVIYTPTWCCSGSDIGKKNCDVWGSRCDAFEVGDIEGNYKTFVAICTMYLVNVKQARYPLHRNILFVLRLASWPIGQNCLCHWNVTVGFCRRWILTVKTVYIKVQ